MSSTHWQEFENLKIDFQEAKKALDDVNPSHDNLEEEYKHLKQKLSQNDVELLKTQEQLTKSFLDYNQLNEDNKSAMHVLKTKYEKECRELRANVGMKERENANLALKCNDLKQDLCRMEGVIQELNVTGSNLEKEVSKLNQKILEEEENFSTSS